MKKLWIFLIILLITSGCMANYLLIPFRYKETLEKTDIKNNAKVNEFTIYGKYFNVSGNITYVDSFDKMCLVLKNSKKEFEYELIIDKTDDNIVTFKTNKNINEGINLEKVELDNYVILLKVVSGENIIYYNLLNNTDYKDLSYYTITKNNQNNLINIMYSKYKDYNFMEFSIKKNVKNKDVYDIVIDPGHGGEDPGAVNGEYKEKDFNLEYALSLKNELESIGLKVKLTRESDEQIASYGKNSRTGIPYEVKAKLMLSLHLNSTYAYIGNGGVEVYIANGDNTIFASKIANNIIDSTDTNFSNNDSARVEDGVYMRTYSKLDIEDVKNEAKRNNWVPYETMNTNTTYYYFIRETGGIITGAFADGRNPIKDANPYYANNYGTECYLVELGYISSAYNLKKLINSKDDYIKGLIESVKYYIEN